MPSNPFSGAKLKIERAKRHLFEVEGACREMPMRQAIELMTGVDSQTGKFKTMYMVHSDMPKQFAPIVGDAANDSRSAFDYIAVALTVPYRCTGTMAHVYFPTGKDRQGFIKARDGYMKGAPAVTSISSATTGSSQSGPVFLGPDIRVLNPTRFDPLLVREVVDQPSLRVTYDHCGSSRRGRSRCKMGARAIGGIGTAQCKCARNVRDAYVSVRRTHIDLRHMYPLITAPSKQKPRHAAGSCLSRSGA
jgi:hypothetical protein